MARINDNGKKNKRKDIRNVLKNKVSLLFVWNQTGVKNEELKISKPW